MIVFLLSVKFMAYLKPFCSFEFTIYFSYLIVCLVLALIDFHYTYIICSWVRNGITRYNCSLFQPLSPKCYHLLRHFMQADATPLGGRSIRPSKIGWWVFVLILGWLMWRGDISWKYANCIPLHIFLPGYSLRLF